MGVVVPFMNYKGGCGKSSLARTYAVEAARAGASVLLADLDEAQRTSKRWAEHRRSNGFTPSIRAEVMTPKLAYEMANKADVIVIDTPGFVTKQTVAIARWSTFCVLPSRANRMDDLHETVRLMHTFKKNGIEDYRFAVALNALRAATAAQDEADARDYLGQVKFRALPGHTRDMREYDIALLEGKALTETTEKILNDEAFGLIDGIAGAVLEAAKKLERKYGRGERGGRGRE